MKRFFCSFVLIFLVISFCSAQNFSELQWQQLGAKKTHVKVPGVLSIDSALHIPSGGSFSLPRGLSISGYLFYDSTGADSGLYVWHNPYIVKIGGGDVSRAGFGMTKSVDTLHGGGQVPGIQRYVVYNAFKLGAPGGYIQLVNRAHSDSMNGYGIGTGGKLMINEGPQLTGSQYGPSMFSINRFLAEWLKDTLNLQYGAMMSLLAQRYIDSTGSRFGTTSGGKKPLWLTDPGITITNQTFLPKDTVDLAAWQDGVTAASFHSLAGIGSNVGYRAHVGGLFPWTTGFMATTDLQRESSRHTVRRMTGNGVSGITTNYRSWQQTMSGTGSEGHYISSMFAFTDIGNTDTSIGPSLTKAQILARSEIDTAGTLKIEPIWRLHNEVRNGVAIYQKGDSDVVHFNGMVNIGPQLPTHSNGLWPQYRFNLMGDGITSGSMWYGNAGRIVGSTGIPSFSSPGTLYFINSDSSEVAFLGHLGFSGASINIVGSNVNSAVRGGIDATMNYHMNPDAPFRMSFLNNLSVLETRFLLNRKKTFVWANDSISFQAPAYKFGGLPNGIGVKQLRIDASGYVTQADTLVATSGTNTPTVTGGANYASSASVQGKFSRIGNIVTYTVSGTVTATAGSAVIVFDVSLPSGYTSNFTDQYDAVGGGIANYAGSNETIQCLANTTNDRLQLTTSTVGSTNARYFAITVQYEVK